MSALTPIHTPGTVRPVGHYSQAVIANGFVFVSGQLPSDLATGKTEVGTIEQQTELALRNTGRILEAAGSSLEHAVQMTIYVSRIEDWGAVNQTYARIMGDHRPTRAIVPVMPLHYGTGIEIQCIAVVPPKRRPRPASNAKAKATGGGRGAARTKAAQPRRRAR